MPAVKEPKRPNHRKTMNILLTNDDGIHAEGLCALHQALVCEHNVFVVAPDSERSAVGHAITIADPLRAHPVMRRTGTGSRKLFGWAVSGTPADCVKLGLSEILRDKVDLVVSGINLGPNVGINVLYSGTVSAATEAAILGIKSIAISLNSYSEPDYCYAAQVAARLAEWTYKTDLPAGVAINVNIPAIPPGKIRGIKFTRQGTSRYEEKFEKRMDPRGNIYYWQAGSKPSASDDPSVDRIAIEQGYITITPIHYDMTDYHALKLLPDFMALSL